MKTVIQSPVRAVATIVCGLAFLAGVAFVLARPSAGSPHGSGTPVAPARGEAGSKSPPFAGPDLTGLRCGCNSLYVYLRLRGVAVTYDTVLAEVPVSARGTSLVELRDAASRLGAEATIFSATGETLREFQCPVIAHLDPSPEWEQDHGHFVVFVPREDGRVVVIDGTTGETKDCDPDELKRIGWSGYVLAPAQRTSALLGAALGIGLFGLLAVSFSAVRSLPYRVGAKSHNHPSSD